MPTASAPRMRDLASAPATRRTLLYITNGESAASTLRPTTLCGAVLPWQDTRGRSWRCPGRTSCRTRARFLADRGLGRQQALLSSLERRDQQLLDTLHADGRVVLWFKYDLHDHLQLLDVLTLAHAAGAAPELITVGAFPGKPSFAGLGELTARDRDALARTAPGRSRGSRGSGSRLGRVPGTGAHSTGRVGNTRHHVPAVPRARAATAARRTARAQGRTLAHRTARARRNRRRRPHAPSRLRRVIRVDEKGLPVAQKEC